MSKEIQSEKDQDKDVLNNEKPEEAPSSEESAETAGPEEETIESRLARSEAEVADLKDRLLRQMAEFDNYRKRTMKEKAEIILNGSAGVITDILVAEGDEVKAGDTVVVLEAMKMANNLTAEKDGKVTAVCVKIGESVMEDDALVVIE